MPKIRKQKPVPIHRRPQKGGSEAEGNLDEALKTFFTELPQRRKSALDELKHGWDETENPLFVWNAWQFSREAGLPVPEWVDEYFDGCARALLSYPNEAKDIPALIGFVKKAPFKTFRDELIRREAVSIVRQEFEKDQKTVTAYRVAANVMLQRYGFDFSERTIENWHNEID
jgi:hypothetical protein